MYPPNAIVALLLIVEKLPVILEKNGMNGFHIYSMILFHSMQSIIGIFCSRVSLFANCSFESLLVDSQL